MRLWTVTFIHENDTFVTACSLLQETPVDCRQPWRHWCFSCFSAHWLTP